MARLRIHISTLMVCTSAFALALNLPFGAAHAQERNAYFGQTHQHTSWSLDAYILGNTVTGPEEAYQYSMGQPIKHPAGYDVQIKTPLDFQGVTDHSEYVGVVRLANDPNSPLSKLPVVAFKPPQDEGKKNMTHAGLAKPLGSTLDLSFGSITPRYGAMTLGPATPAPEKKNK